MSSTLHAWLTVVACVGQLGLVALSVARAPVSPLAVPLALLSAGLFSWNFASLAHTVSGAVEWRYLDVALSPMTIPLTLNFIAAFVGRRRQLERVVQSTFVVFGALALVSLSALFWSGTREFAGSAAWAVISLVGALLMIIYSSALLATHHRHVTSAEERVRTRLVVSALIVGGVLSATEFLADIGFKVPRGGNLGALVAAFVLGLVALRFKLLEKELSARSFAYSMALGVLAVSAYLGVFYYLKAHAAMVVVGTVTVTLALSAGLRHVLHVHAVQRQRLERLAVLGRFSAQMAHDIKNPVAALKGAVQYLQAEAEHGALREEHAEFLDLIGKQLGRVERVVDRYHRLGRLETERERVSLNELVDGVVRAQQLSSADGVVLEQVLSEDLPPCRVDTDLVARALENLIRNAREASQAGGRVRVRTERASSPDGAPALSVVVEDSGAGIDPRVAERAFDDLFTTKAGGSGFGLFFVKRVAEAHGGDASLSSCLGSGTQARFWLPAS